jgi:hypothetical protein
MGCGDSAQRLAAELRRLHSAKAIRSGCVADFPSLPSPASATSGAQIGNTMSITLTLGFSLISGHRLLQPAEKCCALPFLIGLVPTIPEMNEYGQPRAETDGP